MVAAQAAENLIFMVLDLIFMMRDIYINSNPDALTKFSTSNRSNELVFSHGTLLK